MVLALVDWRRGLEIDADRCDCESGDSVDDEPPPTGVQPIDGGAAGNASRSRRRWTKGSTSLREIANLVRGGWLRSRSHPHRPLGRARARILHRPGLRGRADVRDAGRGRQADPVRLGRRRRALRRAGGAVSRRAGSGDRLFDRRLAPLGGVARDQEPDRRGGGSAGTGGRARARPRPSLDGQLRRRLVAKLRAGRDRRPSSISARVE